MPTASPGRTITGLGVTFVHSFSHNMTSDNRAAGVRPGISGHNGTS